MNLNLDDGGLYCIILFRKSFFVKNANNDYYYSFIDVAGLALNAQSRVELMQKLARDTDLIAPTATPIQSEPLVASLFLFNKLYNEKGY